MKLSEEMRANCPAPDDNNCGCGWVEYAKEVAQLEAENETLRWKAQAVVDGARGGEFDKLSGFDDYVISYPLVDELADALLTTEEQT